MRRGGAARGPVAADPGRSTSGPTSSAPSTCAASSPWSATGDLQLRGPVFGATLTGNLTANSGVLYFADLVNKRIIDLEDPTYRRPGGHDADPAREPRRQVPEPVPRLAPDRGPAGGDGHRTSGSGRAEANIQLEGRVRLSKSAQTYKPIGTLERAAGQLHAQDRPGDPRLHGDTRTGDLHRRPQRRRSTSRRATRCASVRGDEIPVIANITGTLYAPKLTLESTSGRRSRRPTWSPTSSPAIPPTRPR